MPTTFYLSNGSVQSEPKPNVFVNPAAWTLQTATSYTGPEEGRLEAVNSGVASHRDMNSPATIGYYRMTRFVSKPLAAQTILAQTVQAIMAGFEDLATANAEWAVQIFVWKNDDTGVRGPVLYLPTQFTEMTADAETETSASGTSTELIVQAGDKLCVEVYYSKLAAKAEVLSRHHFGPADVSTYTSRIIFTNDVQLQVTAYTKTFTSDAILKATPIKTFTADALLKGTSTKTFSADGLLRVTSTKIFTADGIIQLTSTKTLQADAILKATLTKTFTADAILKATSTKTFEADAILVTGVQTYTKTFLADAILKATQTKTFTSDAFLKAIQTKTFSADAIVVNVFTKTFLADALLKATATKTFIADAILQATKTKTFLVDTILKATLTKAFSSDALLKGTLTKSFQADALLVKVATKTFLADAILINTFTKTFQADAILKATLTKTFEADAILVTGVEFKTGVFKALYEAAVKKAEATVLVETAQT